MVAVCEKAGGCGVQAIGRCHRCGQAFCGSHQGWQAQTRMVDECGPCTDASGWQQRGMAPYASDADARKEKEGWLRGEVRPALLASATAPWVPLVVHDGYRKKPWRPGINKRPHSERYDELGHSVGRGVIIGTFEWEFEGKEGAVREERPTVLLAQDLNESPIRPLSCGFFSKDPQSAFSDQLQAYRVSAKGVYNYMWRSVFLELDVRSLLSRYASNTAEPD